MTDRFEKLNPDYANEHAQNAAQSSHDRFSDLNPAQSQESQYAKQIQRINSDRTPAFAYWFVGALIVVLLPFAVYFSAILPKMENKMFADLAWTNPEDVSKFAGTMKLCKADFYSDNEGIAKKGVALELLQKQHSHSVGIGRRSGTRYWEFIANTPVILKLSSADKKVKIYIHPEELDWSFFETYYNGTGKDVDAASYPKDWAKLIATNPSDNYKLSGLPAMHKLTVIGLVTKEDDRFYFKPFSFKHLSHGVIASSATHEQLNDILDGDVIVRDIRTQKSQR